MSEVQSIPEQVEQVLSTSGIGYLSVTSKKGELYSYPVAFYYSQNNVYFMTPISAAKMRFIRDNPTVSFLVDNHILTTGACGAMIQGNAKVYSITKTVLSILSVGPKMLKFAQKYPGMFTFYARGKELPDERKLYKYRLIKIVPSKIVYWTGYKFGRFVPQKSGAPDPLANSDEERKLDTLAKLLSSADEELPPSEIEHGEEWNRGLEEAAKNGVISKEERESINSIRSFLRMASASNRVDAKVSDEERKLLTRWKQRTQG